MEEMTGHVTWHEFLEDMVGLLFTDTNSIIICYHGMLT